MPESQIGDRSRHHTRHTAIEVKISSGQRPEVVEVDKVEGLLKGRVIGERHRRES
jgi:hypothetical protein